jgi:glycosyltransferase involved in cell wall biosynthesis
VINKIKDVQLIIVGGGEYLETLKVKVKKLSLEKYVTFTGWVNDRKKIDDMMSESAIAIATYKPEKKQLYNFTYYADPTKLKDYLGAGLPIILTDVSYNAKIIEDKKCGILVKYDKVEIAKAIVSLLQNEEKLVEYRKNSLKYAKEFGWERIFRKAMS